MHGYSRIRSSHTIEPSDSQLSPKNKTQENKTPQPPSELEHEDHASTDQRSGFGAIKFHRNLSISSSSSTPLQLSAVKRAFSMRRSSSVSERYCRIYDQHAALPSTPADEDFERGTDTHNCGSFNKAKKSTNGCRRILKSCKRIFGL